MVRSKQIRYTAAVEEPLLIQSGKDFFDTCKGHWRSDYFHNTHPLVLELACGRGEYTVGLSQQFPEKNFVGVDIKAERMMIGIRNYQWWISDHRWEDNQSTTQYVKTPNVAFLRTIIHHLDQFFAPEEVDEIWIIHPDPRPKWHDERRRLTFKRFVSMYYTILKPGGLLKLKTDDFWLYDYSLDSISQDTRRKLISLTDDLHQSPLLAEQYGITTHYEREAIAEWKTIKYAVWMKS